MTDYSHSQSRSDYRMVHRRQRFESGLGNVTGVGGLIILDRESDFVEVQGEIRGHARTPAFLDRLRHFGGAARKIHRIGARALGFGAGLAERECVFSAVKASFGDEFGDTSDNRRGSCRTSNHRHRAGPYHL